MSQPYPQPLTFTPFEGRLLHFAPHCVHDWPAQYMIATAVFAGANFGDVVEDVAPGVVYQPGTAQARAVFHSACPRNNVRLEDTFLAVERQNRSAPGGWQVVRFFHCCLSHAAVLWRCPHHACWPSAARRASSVLLAQGCTGGLKACRGLLPLQV